MHKGQQQQQPLHREQPERPSFCEKEPPPLSNRTIRPWRGIFLSYFLLFCGLLFFTHGFHKYDTYTIWDLLAVWLLSVMLIIPGLYFGVLVLMIELGVKGFSYRNHPELNY